MGMKLFRLGMKKESEPSPSSPSSSGSSAHVAPSPRFSTAAAAFDTPDLHRLFNDFDADGDGRISHADLVSLLRRLSAGGTTTDPAGVAASMVHAADSDGDGFISLDEFVSVCGGDEGRRGVEEEDELRSAFEVYDRNGDGVISAEELHQVLSGVMGEGAATLAECRSMIRAVDCNGNGTVSFDEFERMMTRRSSPPMRPDQPL